MHLAAGLGGGASPGGGDGSYGGAMRSRRYLVTGGCGFIGSHLAERLLASGHHVRILDDLSTGYRALAPDGAEFVRGDVADAATVREALAGVDGCFHLA